MWENVDFFFKPALPTDLVQWRRKLAIRLSIPEDFSATFKVPPDNTSVLFYHSHWCKEELSAYIERKSYPALVMFAVLESPWCIGDFCDKLSILRNVNFTWCFEKWLKMFYQG